MKDFSITAPGKVVICGEYAVLKGAPAISMAVDCRAIVRVTNSNEDCSSIRTLGYAEGLWNFILERRKFHWLGEAPSGLRILMETIFDEINISLPQQISLTIDTTSFYLNGTDKKLGLGSSSAVTVALLGYLLGKNISKSSFFESARKIHKRIQDGLGSGIDVASSFYGGLLFYANERKIVSDRCLWPNDLKYQIFYSGSSSNTVDFIDRAIGADEKSWYPLCEAAQLVFDLWSTSNTKEILRSMAIYSNTLNNFSKLNGLDIFAAGHQELFEIAQQSSLVYKPCGSGGGDIGIVFSKNIDKINEFCDIARSLDFMPLELKIDNKGVSDLLGANT